MPTRLLILLSGSGRTLLNLHQRTADATLDAAIAAVVASKPCKGLDHALRLGLETHLVQRDLTAGELLAIADHHRADLVVLAGYLRKVPVPPPLEGRILNIHPGPLPGDGTPGPFGGRGMHGLRVHRAVLDAHRRGDITETACTVHLVTPDYDAGPVISAAPCPIEPGDTPETLAARVFERELELYPAAIAQLASRLPPRATGDERQRSTAP